MQLLAAGLALFFAVHLLPTRPAWRLALRDGLGANRYRLIFSLLSMAGFAMIVIGTGRAPDVPVWQSPAWGDVAAALLMLLSLYSLAASWMPSKLRAVTAHPMLWGIAFWAAAHLLTNGDLASMLLFGLFLAYALFDMASANRRGARPQRLPVGFKMEAKVLAAAAVAFVVLAATHPWFAGSRILSLP